MILTARVTFDYSNNNGICRIGTGDASFECQWHRAGGGSIYIVSDPPTISGVAIANDVSDISEIRDSSRYDFSSRVRHPMMHQIVILRNRKNMYAAIRFFSIRAAGYGSTVDEVNFEYIILQDGSRNFSGIQPIKVTDASFNKRVLLIGAGFSKNWGGLLASEISNNILSHPQVLQRPQLKSLILNEPSFEDALEKVKTGRYEIEDQIALESAIERAFSQMDESYKNPNPNVRPLMINGFISEFCPGPVAQSTGYVFSLNQDLLLERIYGCRPEKQQLVLPGIKWPGNPPSYAASANIPNAIINNITNEGEPNLLKNFNLIKLHGSINWRTSEGSSSMIMGRRKQQAISETPLLEWYHRVFEQVLSDGDVKLMVIGYSWGDEHINDIIARAINNHRLSMYSWNPTHPRDALKSKSNEVVILSSLCGVTQRYLTEVMPTNSDLADSPEYKQIRDDFF